MIGKCRYIGPVSLLLALLFSSLPVLSQNLTGKVVSVADGDTITILTDQKQQVKIRLYQIPLFLTLIYLLI